MKTFIMIICALCLVGCTTYSGTYIPTKKTRYYSNDNKYQGYSIETPYSERFYDSRGHYIGKSIKARY